jgi:hypothetical protein
MSISRWITLASCYAAAGLISIPVADLTFRLLGDRPSEDLNGLFEGWVDGTYRLAKGVRTSAEFYSGPMEVYTDSLRLRTGAQPGRWHHRGDTTDILLLGDSQTFGNNLNWPETIAGQLDSLAQTAGWRVANAGTGAHSMRNQLDVARTLIEQDSLVPRRLVLLVTPVMMNNPGARNRVRVGEDGQLYQGEPTPIRRLTKWLKMNTTVYARARGTFRYVKESLVADATAVDQRDPGVLQFYNVETDAAAKRDSLVVQLDSLNRLAREHGATAYVAYLPLAIEGTFDEVAQVAKERNVKVARDLPQSILAEAATRAEIPLIDVRPALDSAVSRRHPLTVVADPHYSAPLSGLIAGELWKGLRSHSSRDGRDASH